MRRSTASVLFRILQDNENKKRISEFNISRVYKGHGHGFAIQWSKYHFPTPTPNLTWGHPYRKQQLYKARVQSVVR